MNTNRDYCVFILSYNRANNVLTYNTLINQGYTGDIFIICSSDDTTVKEYKQKYKNVFVFNKDNYRGRFDMVDNFDKKNTVIFARNAAFDIAEQIGYKYFVVLDDDYTAFRYSMKPDGSYNTKGEKVLNIDYMMDILIEYYKKTNAKTLAIAQGGDFIGGKDSGLFKKKVGRKSMNFFICSTERRFNYIGRQNDDVNTYIRLGEIGDLFLTVVDYRLEQKATQKNKGGLTDMYLDSGTYVKSFYSVIVHPSAAKIGVMGNKNKRLHHVITWNKCVPMIIEQTYKK